VYIVAKYIGLLTTDGNDDDDVIDDSLGHASEYIYTSVWQYLTG